MNPVVVFLAWITSFGIPLSAQVPELPQAGPVEHSLPTARVKLDITGVEQVKNAMATVIAQEFQAQGGVQLVQEDPRWTIKIVTMTAKDNEGKVWAMGLSVVVLEHGPQMEMLRTLTRAWHYIINAGLLQKDQPLEVGLRELIAGIDGLPATEEPAVLSQHRMCLIPIEKLAGACHDIVVDFNARFVQRAQGDRNEAANQQSAPELSAAY